MSDFIKIRKLEKKKKKSETVSRGYFAEKSCRKIVKGNRST